MIKQVQVNIRIAEPAADRLKRLAEQAGLKLGPFVEKLLELYKPDSNVLQNDSSTAIEELREIVVIQNERINRIELAILKGLEDKAEQIEAADLTETETNEDSPSHPAKSLSLPPQEFNQDKAQFRAAVIELYQEGIISSPDILKALNERGFRNSAGNSYYRNDVRNALKDAGVVEIRQWVG